MGGGGGSYVRAGDGGGEGAAVKYLVFWLSLAGVPVLAWAISLKRTWLRWAFFGMVAGLCLYNETSISFLSHDFYQGSSRGMEVNLVHLLALAVLLALAIRGKWQRAFPEGGIRIYAVYFLLCLPSLWNADSVVVGWLELWKMLMLFLFWHAVYGFLSATGDMEAIVESLALFTVLNFWRLAQQHYIWLVDPRGIFPHRNCMAMAMNLIGPVFLAGYLQLGLRKRLGWICAVAFVVSALAGMWSYSRGAIAMAPLAYGLAAAGVLYGTRHAVGWGKVSVRLLPVLLAGVLGLCVMWPNLVNRFKPTKAHNASRDTRVELAACAAEMMRDHPLAGVGINNWTLNLGPEHPYQERAAEKLGRRFQYTRLVETVYLLVGAECGIPALAAMVVWFAWHWTASLRLCKRLRGAQWHFVAAGLLGGFTANFLQSTLEWVLRQRLNLFFLVFCFGMIAYLRRRRVQPPAEAAA